MRLAHSEGTAASADGVQSTAFRRLRLVYEPGCAAKAAAAA